MTRPDITTAIVYHSGYGHTRRMAEAVADGAAGTPVAIDAQGAIPEDGWRTLDAADAIVFGSPSYMGGPSWQFKRFADGSSRRAVEAVRREPLGETGRIARGEDERREAANLLDRQDLDVSQRGRRRSAGRNQTVRAPVRLRRRAGHAVLATQRGERIAVDPGHGRLRWHRHDESERVLRFAKRDPADEVLLTGHGVVKDQRLLDGDRWHVQCRPFPEDHARVRVARPLERR